MTKAKSFDVLDYERSNVNHRHGCFQQIVGYEQCRWNHLMLSSELVILQNVVLAQCDVTMQSNWWQLCTIYSKLNVETIPSDGPHHEWINSMVIALALPNWGWHEFLGGNDQNLLLAAMPGSWRQNGWFGHKNWTQMSTKILLESSFQQLSIGIKNMVVPIWNNTKLFLKVQTTAASMSFLLYPD